MASPVEDLNSDFSETPYLPEDAFLVAMVDSLPSPESNEQPTTQEIEIPNDDDAQKQGFSAPNHIQYGSQGLVKSVPVDFEIDSPLKQPLSDRFVHNQNDSFGLNRLLSGSPGTPLQPPTSNPPDELPPILIEPVPAISISDARVDKHDISVFSVSLQHPFSQDVDVIFEYPADVQLIGGTGVVSSDADERQGIVNIPKGATSVSLVFEILKTSTLEPGDKFEVQIKDDQVGISPQFIKPIGEAVLLEDEAVDYQATDDIFWTAHQPNKDYNISFAIDISGSMNKGIEVGEPRIDKAKYALVEFIDAYAQAADNIKINIIPFSSSPNNHGAFVYTATDVDDAKDYVLKQGAHSEDGLSIGMMNPDTGEEMGRGTQYNDALYQVRFTLEDSLTNPELADYAPKVYFFSDGRPNPGHGVYDNQNWPDTWSPWPDFIQDPKHDIPNSFADSVDSFAISLGLNPTVAISLQAVASEPDYVFAVDEDFTLFNELLLQTVPEFFNGNFMQNDGLPQAHARVVNIQFQVDDANQYIQENQLSTIGTALNHEIVVISLPNDGAFHAFATPLDGLLYVNQQGEFYYLPPKLNHHVHESFQYTVEDGLSGTNFQASFEINTLAMEHDFHKLVGDDHDSTLSTSGLFGTIMMQGNAGDNTFEIDLDNLPERLIIEDLFDNPNNSLHFTGDNLANPTSLEDLFTNVTQSGQNASLHLSLSTATQSMDLYLDNPGPFSALGLNDTLDYLEGAVHISFA